MTIVIHYTFKELIENEFQVNKNVGSVMCLVVLVGIRSIDSDCPVSLHGLRSS